LKKSTLACFLAIIMTGFSFTILDSEAILPVNLPDESQAPFKVKVIEAGELRAEARPLYTTFGNQAQYVTPSGGVYDGVGDLILTRADFTVRCSGALLTSGIHVLTAAHCVTDEEGNLILESGFATFEGDTGDFQISVVAFATEVHPDWDGDFIRGNDVAVLELVSEAPAEITRYDIDRDGSDDVGAVGDKAGYGRSGNGDNGDVMPSGKKRDGQNKYDDVADTMLEALRLRSGTDFVSGSVLQYDFDNLDPENDAFGFFFGNSDLGLGQPEVNSAPGDSGGPTLTSGEITGITSYGVRLSFLFGSSSDVDDELNSSFGEFSGDTRVSFYADFIDGVLNPPNVDSDGDGFFDITTGGTDCDDSNPAINPGAAEVDDGVDNNCDGNTDEGFDGDSDGFTPIGGADCDDTDATIHPGAAETAYDSIDSDCDGLDPNDVDLDGSPADQAVGGTPDCDDADNTVYPGAPELEDGKDNDCDGEIDEDFELFCDDMTIDELLTGGLYANIIDNRNNPSATLTGSADPDLIIAGNLGDTLVGLGGNDCLIGGSGNDTIQGRGGLDQIFGQGGNDSIGGGGRDDIIYGGAGDDTINGRNGDDTLIGDAGNDILNGGDGTDTCISDLDDTTTPVNCEL